MRRTVWYILLIAITLITLILLWQFSLSIVLFALSLTVAAALKPMINIIAIKTRSKRLALGIVYSIFVGLTLILLWAVGQLFLRDLQNAADDLVNTYNRIKSDWPAADSLFQQSLAEQLPESQDLFKAFLSEEGLIILTKNEGSGQGIFSYFGYFATILVLSVYWSIDQLRFERISISLFPMDYRPKALHIWRAIENGVGTYLRSEITQSLFAGLFLGVGYWMISLQYPVLLAIWTSLARLIPWFGVPIALTPFVLVALGFPISGILAMLYTIVTLTLLRKMVVSGLAYKHSNSSLLIVMFVVLLGDAFGLVGILLAPSLATAVQILLQELYPILTQRYTHEVQEAFNLKKRLSHVQRAAKGKAFPEIMQLINQLYRLVDQTITFMQKY